MALINRTLFTSYTWSARCLKLPPMLLPSLSFPLFPSIFFHLFFSAFDTLFFLPPFYTSGFHTGDFGLWIWLVKENDSKAASGGILRPIFTPSFFKVNCSFQWCFSMCERCVFSTDYLPMNMIKVTETSVYVHFCKPTCPCLYVSAFREVCACICFCKMWPFHTMYVITFFNRYTLCQPGQPVFDIFWSSNTKVLCENSRRDSP